MTQELLDMPVFLLMCMTVVVACAVTLLAELLRWWLRR